MLKIIVAIVIIVVAFIFLLDPAITAGRYLSSKLKEIVGRNDED